MKVLFVSSGNSSKGISPIIHRQAISLEKIGIDIDYFLIRGKGVYGYIKNIHSLRKKIRSENFDLVHAHYGSSALLSFLAFSQKKLIISFMGSDLFGTFNKRSKYTFKSKILKTLYCLISKYFAFHTIVKSKGMKEKLFNNTNCTIIPNGVDLDVFYPQKDSTLKNYKQILFVGNTEKKVKNFKLLSEAVRKIKKINFKIKIASNKSQDELNRIYNESDVLVLSSFHEGSPNVIKEAMACNLPIISTDVGDVKELFSGVKGCLITENHPDDLSHKLLKIFNFHEFSDGREQIIKKNIDSLSIARKIYDIYTLES